MELEITWPEGIEELPISEKDVAADTVTLWEGPKRTGRSIRISKIPSEVISLRISGNSVLDKWLRERTFPYLRRSFRRGDLELLIDLIARIAQQQAVLAEVSAALEPHLHEGAILTPPRG